MMVIASGWRRYADPRLPSQALGLLLLWATRAGETLILVHGAAPGLDTLVEEWAGLTNRQWLRDRPESVVDPVATDPYPADWKLGRAAGRIRNQHMWTRHWHRTDLCLAFPGPPNRSSGTSHCIELAAQYNCPAWVIPWGATRLTPPPTARLVPTPDDAALDLQRSIEWYPTRHATAPNTEPATKSDVATAPNTAGC